MRSARRPGTYTTQPPPPDLQNGERKDPAWDVSLRLIARLQVGLAAAYRMISIGVAMHLRTCLFVLFVAPVASLLPGGALAQTSIEVLSQELSTLAQQDKFAGSVLIRRNGENLLAAGYGLADRDKGTKFTAETVSTIGSITKQFTGAAVLKLQESGKLSVQDKLATFFSDVPADKSGITLHQLLTHTAGFPDALGNDETFIDA